MILSIGLSPLFIDSDLLKRKKPSSSYMDNAVKAARSKPSKPQLRPGCFIFNLSLSRVLCLLNACLYICLVNK